MIPNISFEEKSKQVYDFFTSVINEVNIVNLKNDNKFDLVPLRVQMILAFSLVDVFSSYWLEFKDISAKNHRDQFTQWYEAYCKHRRNRSYKGYWKSLSVNRLYDLRCSMIHFFGLSQVSEGVSFVLVNNNLPESKRSKFGRNINSKLKYKSILIKPNHIISLFREGAKIMLDDWMRAIKKANRGNTQVELEYRAGIDRVWQKFFKEGAISVPVDVV